MQYLAQFNVRHCIIGASRLDTHGPSDFNAGAISVKRMMVENADQSILVLVYEKLEKAAFERICPLNTINWLVTDRSPPEALSSALSAAGVR